MTSLDQLVGKETDKILDSLEKKYNEKKEQDKLKNIEYLRNNKEKLSQLFVDIFHKCFFGIPGDTSHYPIILKSNLLKGIETRIMAAHSRMKGNIFNVFLKLLFNALKEYLYEIISHPPEENFNKSRIEELLETKGAEFLNKWYLNYGHKSIGDFDYYTLFFVGIPEDLALLLISDPLGAYMQKSTRYVPFIVNKSLNAYRPKLIKCRDGSLCDKLSLIIQEINSYYDSLANSFDELMIEAKEVVKKYYTLEVHREALKQRNLKVDPRKAYEKALEKHALDLVRGLLPLSLETHIAVKLNRRTWEGILPVVKHYLDNYLFLEKKDFYDTILDVLNRGLTQGARINPNNMDEEVLDQNYKFLPIPSESLEFKLITERDIELDLMGLENALRDPRILKLFESLKSSKKLLEDTRHPLLEREDYRISTSFPITIGAARDIRRHRSLNQEPHPLNLFNTEILDYIIVSPLVLETEKLKEFIEENIPRMISVYKELYNIWPEIRTASARGELELCLSPLWALPLYTTIRQKISGSLKNMFYAITLRSTKEGNPEYVSLMIQIANSINEIFERYIGGGFMSTKEGVIITRELLENSNDGWIYPYLYAGRAGEVGREFKHRKEYS